MCDYSEATDDVLITDDSQVRGYAHLNESVQILDSSMAFERCELKGCVQMSGRARAAGRAILADRCVVTDEAFVRGSFFGSGTMCVDGNMELDGSASDEVVVRRRKAENRKAERTLALEPGLTV